MDEVLSRARVIDRQVAQSATHLDIGELFKADLSKDPAENPMSDPLAWEDWLFNLMLTHPGEYRDRWGPLAPVMVFPPNVYPPPVDAFPDDAVDMFARQLDETTVAAARARLADFLWMRRREIQYADLAIAEYGRAATAVIGGEMGSRWHLTIWSEPMISPDP
jgi:hypothetical protein